MVFTADQTTAFFTDAGELAITVETCDQLISEGLEDVADLVEFDDNSLKQIIHNFRLLEGRILDTNTGAPDGTTITMPFFLFGRKSQLRLKTAITISKYWETVGRTPSAANMHWNPVIKTFFKHWKALKAQKDDEDPKVPKIS